jgi:hypothetical protein
MNTQVTQHETQGDQRVQRSVGINKTSKGPSNNSVYQFTNRVIC